MSTARPLPVCRRPSQIMMIESCYTVPLDQIPPDPLVDEDHVYESLDEIGSSQGTISNILGRAGKLPPKAPTPLLKRRPLSERSNLPSSALLPHAASVSASAKPVTKCPSSSEKADEPEGDKRKIANNGRSRKDRFYFWKNSNKCKGNYLYE